ncbi:hypothetical protein [Maritalea sp.]|uniref:hypothetical protein n=1 Tax=Maritalea sp. TaxID=2003361 RepID=UPI003EF53AAE
MVLADLNTLFEISIGLILASSIAQAFLKKSIQEITDKLLQINNLSTIASLADTERADYEERVFELECELAAVSLELLPFCKKLEILNLSALPIVIFCTIYGTFTSVESPTFFLIFCSVVCLMWGPTFAAIAWVKVDASLSPLRTTSNSIRDDILGQNSSHS